MWNLAAYTVLFKLCTVIVTIVIITDKKRSQVELPCYSKYLLLAAYFASYNPATTDRRFFAKKCTGKMSNRMKRFTKTTKNTEKKFLGKFFH